MTAKYRAFQFLGALAVLAGFIVALNFFRMLFLGGLENIWVIARTVLIGLVSSYFFFIGVRSLRYGDSSEKPRTKFQWGRILVGIWLIFTVASNTFNPAPNLLKASNATQDLAMKTMNGVIALAGAYLILWGFSPRKELKVPSEDPSYPIAPACSRE